MPNAKNTSAAVRNLLVNCAELAPGQTLLILHEPPEIGYYSPTLATTFAETARQSGVDVEMREIPFSPFASNPDPWTVHAMQNADCTLFLARSGDQIRFGDALSDVCAVVCYALDETSLGSPFGRVTYQGFVELKQAIDRAMRAARMIHVTCPLGTDLSGQIDPTAPRSDVNIRRFPMSVFSPNPAVHFSGQVAQRGFLVGTGSNYYAPYACRLNGTVMVNIEGTRISGFSGSPEDVETVQRHYSRVADALGIDGYFVHSWHAGIHPGCSTPTPAPLNFERWTGSAFGNPRLLHVHTCGAYAPGEISLNVLDPTIALDGVAVWERGRLLPDRIAGGDAILGTFPDLAACFQSPAQDCGLGSDGQLGFL